MVGLEKKVGLGFDFADSVFCTFDFFSFSFIRNRDLGLGFVSRPLFCSLLLNFLSFLFPCLPEKGI